MSERIHIATRKGLFTATRRSGRWELAETAFLGDPVTNVLPDARDGMLYATLNLGHFGVKLRRSTNDGKDWQELAAPSYPAQPEGASGAPWKLIQLWTLEAGGRDEPGALWAGTIPGGLFRSRDRGESWSLVRPLWDRPERGEWFGGGYDQPGIHSIVVDPRSSAHVTIGISCGGVWATRDRGESWQLAAQGMRAAFMPPEQANNPNIQDPHRVVACSARPDTMWSQHHNGIFRTTNAGELWTEVTTATISTFGFAVAAHPVNPDVAWFVPAIKDEKRVPVDARLVVTRTRDGGRTFEVLRDGLPSEPAYDLVYRHGLDVDATGERLAMGSTTGGFWISQDQGVSWQCLSKYLPPIHAVRFDNR